MFNETYELMFYAYLLSFACSVQLTTNVVLKIYVFVSGVNEFCIVCEE